MVELEGLASEQRMVLDEETVELRTIPFHPLPVAGWVQRDYRKRRKPTSWIILALVRGSCWIQDDQASMISKCQFTLFTFLNRRRAPTKSYQSH